MEINVYIANLGKYNEGELVGAWFTLPVDSDEIAKKIGLNGVYEEMAIHDFEAPFKINEYDSMELLNEYAERFELLNEIEAKAVAMALENGHVNDLHEALDAFENGEIHFYYECKSMEDVAYEVVENMGMLDNMPELAQRYFNYEAFGRDLEIEGSFYELEYGTWIEIN